MVVTQIGFQTQDESRYKEFLRPIGAYLDWLQARYVTVCEIDNGFVWHCFPYGDLTKPVSGMIGRDELPRLLERLRKSRRLRKGIFGRRPHSHRRRQPRGAGIDTVCPDGYEEAFRSIGARLDRAKAIAILIVEQRDKLSVNYRFPVAGLLRRDLKRFDISSNQHEDEFNREQLAHLIAMSRSHRHNPFYY